MNDRLTLTNEFATVVVEVDSSGAGPRLKITDAGSHVYTCFDPFELQSLAWSRHRDLETLMDPGHRERVLGLQPDAEPESSRGPDDHGSPPSPCTTKEA